MRNTKTHPALVVPVLVFCWLLSGVLLVTGVLLVVLHNEIELRVLGTGLAIASMVVMCCAAVATVQAYRVFSRKDLAPLITDEFTANYE